jgi:hypoxanthine phosphoribosyltransferase
MIGALKGGFIFLGDLVRCVSRPHEIDFVVAASYGDSMTSSGQVRLLYDPATDLAGRHVLLVEDIIDSGTTLNMLVHLLQARGPASLEICALLHKRKAKLVLEPRFVGFDAPDEFLVGYGLDYGEQYRHLPFVGSLNRE